MKIYEVVTVTNKIAQAFKVLMPQLSPSADIPTKHELQAIVDSGFTKLFVAEDDEIIGTLTLVFNTIPTGKKAWIEDVVVDNKARGKGAGEKLVHYAIGYAKKNGVAKIDLTSSPERVAANKLYQKIGFELRTTNVYRLVSRSEV
jgi:ribosomal protein S18 acetylase RimI-like enzyme